MPCGWGPAVPGYVQGLVTTRTDIQQAARRRLGFTRLRPGQEEAIAEAASGRDTLAVMPTGSGKSAVYEIAGALRDGPTVVVSPLIALQRDQVDALAGARIGRAEQLNSTMTAHERRAVLDALRHGHVDFVFLAPEQLNNPDTLQAVQEAHPGLFVVDEAHCVSSWGHDFRPDYLHLAAAAEAVGRPPVLALTATAAPPVRDEIVRQLAMRDPAVVVRDFDRPNLHLTVETHHDPEAKEASLLERLPALEGHGIVYVATRRETTDLAERLRHAGLRAAAYHGGLAGAERDQVHERFMAGGLDVIVATTAFGMGIDKADVRFVIHFEISDSIDSYYQEIGRAGRDGSPAEAVLLYRPEDLGLRRFFASGGDVDAEVLSEVAELVLGSDTGVSAEAAAEAVGRPGTRVEQALNRLAETGWARRSPQGLFTATDADADATAAAADTVVAQEAARQLHRSRVDMMRFYAETRSCRRQFILGYFGEPYDPPCGNCDNCDAGRSPSGEASHEAGPFRAGDRVRHQEWGDGEVMRVQDGEQVTVLFAQVGYRTLSVALVEENDLLRVIH